ncbi:hypothetical protein H0H81_000193 [Sphagnurus paluster]|uniref:Uncharacterized protein n=1 Tax=Sphagnurus paluster TaxID=117069 RepID=A0A9P7FRK3_9AGAR|nr:hypothetical protein H0H81_000193 [Sphagnurus paluster]
MASSTRYSLRTHSAATAVVTGEQLIQSVPSVPGAFPPASQPDGGSPRSARDTRSYRDAAASRLPSPVPQRDGDPASSGSEAGGDGRQPSAVNFSLGAVIDRSLGGRTSNSIVRVHARAESPKINKVLFNKEITVAFAQKSIANNVNGDGDNDRPITVDSAIGSSLASIDIAEPSTKVKGKGPDPMNWGGIDLRDDEIDVDIQHEQLNSWACKKRNEPSKARDTVPETHSNKGTEGARMAPTAVERIEHALEGSKLSGSPVTTSNDDSGPWAQLAPNSYLGAAIRGLTGDGGDPGDPSPLYSSSGDESDHGTSSDESGGGRRAKRSKKSKKKKTKSLLKPVAPREYDGSPDSRNYHRFITEGTDYVQSGKVEE